MLEDSELFDKDDTITIHKNKIILNKYNDDDKPIEDLKKYLNELDGNWILEFQTDDDFKSNESFILKNDALFYEIFTDINVKSEYSEVLNNLTYPVFCEFLESTRNSEYIYNNDDWNRYEEYKLFGMKNPNIEQWTSFHIIELHRLYNTYMLNLNLGNIKNFIEFCYINSKSEQLPKY